MERTVRRDEPQSYAAAVTGLWERAGAALTRLERIAAAPAETVADAFVDELPSLQYSLHSASELAVGIEPPVGAEALHQELVAALGEARDATAEIALALEAADADLIEPLLPEWRGILFRVRLARLRAVEGGARQSGRRADAAPRKRGTRRRSSLWAVVASVLVGGGAFLFTAGAVLAAWPVWAAGLALFAGGFVLYRP